MISKATTVPAFLKQLPADRRAALPRLRALFLKAAPKAVESMRHGMPTYDAGPGQPLFAMNAQKHDLALSVCDTAVVAAHRSDLEGLDCGKSCIRFRGLDQLPLPAVMKILAAAVRQAGPQRTSRA
jgi:uncharacterized protein YdhG (YjbR/CyaY superfamily)